MNPTSVSRETLDDLRVYEALLRKWNDRINLVSRSTLDDFQSRHIADCLQLVDLAPHTGHWLDLGSGGGLPGLVAAVARRGYGAVSLIESDRRKASFLSTVRRELQLNAQVICERIEAVAPIRADVVSARALAPLPSLLGYLDRHGHSKTLGLFPKGRTWEREVLAAEREWSYDLDLQPSRVEDGAMILQIRNLARA